MKQTLYKVIGGVEMYIVEDVGSNDNFPVYGEIDEEEIESIPEIDSQEHKKFMQDVKEITIPRSVVNQIKSHGSNLDDIIIGMLHGDRPN